MFLVSFFALAKRAVVYRREVDRNAWWRWRALPAPV
jgi:hypothetical protein